MPTEIDHTSVTPIPSHSRDTPPHFDSDSVSELTELKFSDSLNRVEGPIDDIPENAKMINYEPGVIPGLFSPCHCIENEAKLHIMKAIKYGYNYLHCPALKQSFELTCSNFK